MYLLLNVIGEFKLYNKSSSLKVVSITSYKTIVERAEEKGGI